MFREGFWEGGCVLTEEYVWQLVALREDYDYPHVYMRKSKVPTDYELAPGVWAQPVCRGDRRYNTKTTNRALDRYHFLLLHSPDPVENLLGLLSIIYWGFYTSRGRAKHYAASHLAGLKSKPGTTAQDAATALAAVMSTTDIGKALGHLSSLAVLGQMSFASKVIAQLRPEVAGVRDRQLEDGLSDEQWTKGTPIREILGAVSIVRRQEDFTKWCAFLVCLAEQLNAGIDAGEPWGWSENERQRRWRAIDVERALFKYCQRKKKDREGLKRFLDEAVSIRRCTA